MPICLWNEGQTSHAHQTSFHVQQHVHMLRDANANRLVRSERLSPSARALVVNARRRSETEEKRGRVVDGPGRGGKTMGNVVDFPDDYSFLPRYLHTY